MSTPKHQPSMLAINEESPGQGGKVQEPEQGREEESVQGTRGGSLLSEEEQKEKRQKEKRQKEESQKIRFAWWIVGCCVKCWCCRWWWYIRRSICYSRAKRSVFSGWQYNVLPPWFLLFRNSGVHLFVEKRVLGCVRHVV